MSNKNRFRQYTLLAFILLMGIAIFFKILPFMGGLLGAMTVYILLRGQMRYLTERKKWRKGFAATALIVETIFLFLIPLLSFTSVLVDSISNLQFDSRMIIDSAQKMVDSLHEHTGYDLFEIDNIKQVVSILPTIGQYIINSISSLTVNLVVMIFVLYFMLIGSRKMEAYIFELLPFSPDYKREMTHEIRLIVTSNAVGIPLLAIIQGLIAMIGYYIFGSPHPIALSVLTCFATIIPMIGTALIWVPVAIYQLVSGDWFGGIGLIAYGSLVTTQVDNLIRFILQKKMADIHPLITIFGVVIGLSLFGFMGIIFGPLLLSLFIFCFEVYRKEYLS